ncbi:MAG UNVERIFIED_CONTAM: hypothetical protein LVT10_06160 [Anaerolineae bacterium]|jgi:hypothetical protein
MPLAWCHPFYRMMQAMVDQLLWMRGLGISDRLIEALVLLSWLGLGSVVLPVALTFGATLLTRQSLRKPKPSLREVVATFAPAFVPIGFAIWFAHYMFHLLDWHVDNYPCFATSARFTTQLATGGFPSIHPF